jgi:hypothetical protein
MRTFYAERQEVLIKEVKSRLAGLLEGENEDNRRALEMEIAKWRPIGN